MRRINYGESAECPIHYATDHGHCDGELWYVIHPDALRRWSAHD